MSNIIQQPQTYEQLLNLFHRSNDLIQFFTADGEITQVNSSWQKKLGYNADEIKNLNYREIIHPNHQSSFEQFIQLIQTEEVEVAEKFETILITKHGKPIFISGDISANKQQNGKIYFQGIFHDITDRVKAEKAQSLFYSIANMAIDTKDLNEFYANIHFELSKIIPVRNFYICLHEIGQSTIRFPYYINEFSNEETKTIERPIAKGLPEYAIKFNKPVIFTNHDIKTLIKGQKIEIGDRIPKHWMGVPLRLDKKTIGLIAIQSFQEDNKFSVQDLEILDFISGQIALCIDRKEKSELFQQQSARLNAIFQSGTHMVWSINRRLSLTSWNEQFEEFLEKVYNINLSKTSTPSIKDTSFHRNWEKFFIRVFKGESISFEMPFREQKNIKWLSFFLNPIYFQDKEIMEISGIAHDVTEKKTSELKILRSEKKFRDIFESLQDIYFRCSLDGSITMISPSVYALTGYSEKDVLKKDITNYYLYNKQTKRLLLQLIRHKTVRNFEASIVHKTGRITKCICNLKLVYDNQSKPSKIEGIVRDITDLKKTNEALEKAKVLAENSLKAKEDFLANMSHEIRTPMNGIIGVVDLIGSTPLNEEQDGYISTIKKSSQTLLSILNSILDLSKIEAGKMKLKPSVIQFSDTLEKLTALFKQQASENDINFDYELDEKLPKYLEIDELRLLQILSNLSSNALKFTKPHGQVKIHMNAVTQMKESFLIKAEVRDSGIGISKENLEKLFKNFSQVDHSSSKEFGGTGLGLAISKQLAKLMGGDIGVFSKEGKGSTFWFTFWAKASSQTHWIKTSNSAKEDSFLVIDTKTKVPQILIVDDNQINRQVAKQILVKAGCQVITASSGEIAINLVSKNTFDIIFMDIQMPIMDGVATTRALRSQYGSNLPPIVAMTAYSMQNDKEKFIEGGLDDYISKPIKASILIRKTSQLLGLNTFEFKEEELLFNKGSQERVITPSVDPNILDNTKVEISTTTTSNVVQESSKLEIDPKVVQSLMKYAGDSTIEFYQEFEVECGELLNDFNKAWEQRSKDDLQKILHTLKGNAGTLGIKELHEITKKMEDSVKNDNFSYIDDNLYRLNSVYSTYQSEYQRLIKSILRE